MKAKDLMTKDVACCTVDQSLQDAARLMVECDCGAIPVVDEMGAPIGVITDRDITCRTVARGINPLDHRAGDFMTSPVDTVSENTSLDDCCEIMERDQIRRLVVVDRSGKCCGMIAQADIARHTDEHHAAEVLQEVSQPARSR